MKEVFIGFIVVLFFACIAHAGLNDGLVAYYPLNGDAHDASGNGYDGVIYGATPITDELGNPYAFSFNPGDNYNNYIDIPNSASLNFAEGFKIEAWARFTEYNSDSIIVGKLVSGVISGYFLGVYDNKIDFYVNNRLFTNLPNEYPDRLKTQTSYNDGEWHHVVGIYNGTTQSLFVDDNLMGQQEIPYTSFSTANISIGGLADQQYSSNAFKGDIDDVRIYEIPEPATVGLLALGGVILRKRKAW